MRAWANTAAFFSGRPAVRFAAIVTTCLWSIAPLERSWGQANNQCSTAQIVSVGSFPFNMGAATLDPGIAVCDPDMFSDIWYRYTAGCTGEAVIDTCGPGSGSSGPDTIIQVFQGCTCASNPGPTLACEDDSGCGGDGYSARAVVPVTAGQCFLIRLSGWQGQPASGTLRIACGPPCNVTCAAGSSPEGEPICFAGYQDTYNSGCNTALPVFQSVTPGQTICAEAGTWSADVLCDGPEDCPANRPCNGGICAQGPYSHRDTDWFELNLNGAPGSTTVTWTATAEFPVLIGIFDNGGLPDCAATSALLVSNSATDCLSTSVTATLSPGIWWLVATPRDFTGVPCGSTYNVALTTPLPNDTCLSALPAGDGAPAASGGNNGAALPDDAEASCAPSDGDVYWTYVATCEGTVTVSTEGSGVQDTVLSVQDFCGGPEVACDDDSGTGQHSLLSFPSLVGEDWQIRVASYGDGTATYGNITLNISCTPTTAPGACCYPGGGCADGLFEADCTGSGGTFQGGGSTCMPGLCAGFPPALSDYWTTEPGTFQSFTDTPIPAGFFAPGSLPFEGIITYSGEPLDFGLFGDADTIIRRMGDPFQPSDPPGTQNTVPIEIIALNIVSISPITVQFGGGAVQQWNVAVDLSSVSPPMGSMTATKTHANGGTFNSTLFVQPLFTFTNVTNPGDVRVFDTGEAGMPPIQLHGNGQSFVHFVNPQLDVVVDTQSAFVPGIVETVQGDPLSQTVTTVTEESENERHRVRRPRRLPPPRYRDPWYTWRNNATRGGAEPNYQSFAPNPIPADFFDPGSDPFDGTVYFRGVALDPDDLGNADTIVEREGDPVTAVDPVGAVGTVSIEIVALSLTSLEPIAVTFGGANEEVWKVAVDLSTVGQQQGTMTATKTHANGGTFDSILPVQPRYTFTRLIDGAVRVLDTGLAGLPAVALQGTDMSFVNNLDPGVDVVNDGTSNFVPGVEELVPGDSTSQTPFPDTEAEAWAAHTVCPPPKKPPPHYWYTYTGGQLRGTDYNYQDLTLPAGFFGPGCDPFTGRVQFAGEPLDDFETGNADTAVQPSGRPIRTDDPIGTIGVTELELTALSLASSEPLAVVCNGELTLWSVTAGLSPTTPAPVGTMTATKTHANGGTFDSSLFVQPLLTFTADAGCACGDVNRDGTIDLLDWGSIADAMNGPDGAVGPGGGCGPGQDICPCADSDHDGDIDLRDVLVVMEAFAGPGTQTCVATPAQQTVALDTGAAGIPPIDFTAQDTPFVHTVNSAEETYYSEGSSMITGVVETIPGDTTSQQSVPTSEYGQYSRHTVCPPPRCRVTIFGEEKICKGHTTVLTAIGVPPGGRCAWFWATTGTGTIALTAFNCTAVVTGLTTSSAVGDITITVVYFAPNGAVCRDTHRFTVAELEITETPAAYLPENTNTVQYTATIKPPGCTDKIKFSLFGVSDFPGDAMNHGAQPDDEKDYKLKAADNAAFDITADEQMATTKAEVNSATVTVRAYDYGAIGKIKARMVREGCESPERKIPKDTDCDTLPDAYEDAQPDKNKALADTDGDATADGVEDDDTLRAVVANGGPPYHPTARTDQGLLGDGLVAFEEYRGFFISGAHTRTTTRTKDVFANADANVLVGIGMFPNLTNFNVREILNTEWDGVANRYINSKRSGIPGATDQRALRIILNNALGPIGQTFGIGAAINQSPNETLRIEIKVGTHVAGMPANDAGPDGNLCTADDAAVDQIPGAGTGLSAANAQTVLAETVAHECGHGVHAEHNFCTGDIHVIPFLNGLPNSVTVTAGPNGVCNSAKGGDDVQFIPVGQGTPNSLCIVGPGPGLNAATVVGGDDIAALNMVLTGPNGVCQSTAGGTDVQVIPVGRGAPGSNCVSTGADGLSNTAAAGDDVQRIPVGDGEPNQVGITPGTDGVRHTAAGGDDTVVGNNITTGADGILHSLARLDNEGVISIMTSNVLFPVPATYSGDDLDQVRFHLKHP